MLARPETLRCIECGLASGDARFAFHQGRTENGPAYWCDRGVLCSPRCSVAHYHRRSAEGTLPDDPAPDIYRH